MSAKLRSVLEYEPDNSNSCLAARCLDRYFELRVKQVEHKEEAEIDPRLTSVVERMLDRCGLCAAGP